MADPAACHHWSSGQRVLLGAGGGRRKPGSAPPTAGGQRKAQAYQHFPRYRRCTFAPCKDIGVTVFMNDDHYFNSQWRTAVKIQSFAQVRTCTSTNTRTRFRDGATSASLLGNRWGTRQWLYLAVFIIFLVCSTVISPFAFDLIQTSSNLTAPKRETFWSVVTRYSPRGVVTQAWYRTFIQSSTEIQSFSGVLLKQAPS